MEGPGGDDGASEISYESVASEGGLEYGERGRDQRRQIISSSHCVQVFQSLCDFDGAFCERGELAPPGVAEGSSKANGRRKQGAGPQDLSHDPLLGLPPRILRFDGAMEAWTEEIPMPIQPWTEESLPYGSLNDAGQRPDLAVLRAGNQRAIIWYFTQGFCADLFPCFLCPDEIGLKRWVRALLESNFTIESTHVEVGRVHLPPEALKGDKGRAQWLKSLLTAMQASKWSPAGEARGLQVKRRLSHVSMSIGDVVQIGRHLFAACLDGFVHVQESDRLLPQGFEAGDEDILEFGDLADELPSKAPKKKGGSKHAGAQEGAGDDSKGGQGQGARKGKGGGGDGGEPGTARGGKKGKGKGKGKGKDRGTEQRAAEPGPNARADRRTLRAQLQAKRESTRAS